MCVGSPSCSEQAARLVGERGAQLSVLAARRVPALCALYEHAGGELNAAQQYNYAKVTHLHCPITLNYTCAPIALIPPLP